ncbi:hypothetical protein TWF281_010956 [Arthrobotrys megalospora]
MAKATLQKLLPRDPVDEILKSSSDTHIRTLLRNLCESSSEIKEKAQMLHQRILELTPPPPPLNLTDSDIAIIASRSHRKRKVLFDGAGDTYNSYHDRSPDYQRRRVTRRYRLGKLELGLNGGLHTCKKGHDQIDDIGAPVSPLTKLPVRRPMEWCERRGRQTVYPLILIENGESRNKEHGDSQTTCLPSLNELIFHNPNYSLTLPPILGLYEQDTSPVGTEELEVGRLADADLQDQREVNVLDTETVEVNYGSGEVAISEDKTEPSTSDTIY